MRFEYDGRLVRILLEISRGTAAALRRVDVRTMSSRAEHEIRRALWRRTVNAIKNRGQDEP